MTNTANSNITDLMIEEAVDVFKRYYKIQFDSGLMRKVIESDKELIKETIDGAVGDTYVRCYLLDLLLKEVGVPSYPANMDSDEYVKLFLEKLHERLSCGLFKIVAA